MRSSPGRPPKLDAVRRKRLVRLLVKGVMEYGSRTNLWITARIAELVRREFGVEYHRDHIGRLLHSLGWSVQKLERRALERNEEAIQRWKRKDWPRIKKLCAAGCPHSLCQRIGILLIPLHGATLGPPPGRLPFLATARTAGQDVRHFRNFFRPPVASAQPLLSALLLEQR